MGIDCDINVKFRGKIDHAVLDKIVKTGIKAGLIYEDYRLKEECFETCNIKNLSKHVLLGLEKNNLHSSSTIDAKYKDVQFDICFYYDEHKISSFFLLPDSVGWKKDFIDSYGIDLRKYLKEIVIPLVEPLCLKQIFIEQNAEPLQITSPNNDPYIVGYADLNKSNFTQEHVKVLVSNLIKAEITALKDGQPLSKDEIENIVWQAIEKNEVEYLDAAYQEYPFKLGLGDDPEGNIKIIPLKPYRMKKTDTSECIDMAFYIERLLDIVDGFYLYGLNTSGF